MRDHSLAATPHRRAGARHRVEGMGNDHQQLPACASLPTRLCPTTLLNKIATQLFDNSTFSADPRSLFNHAGEISELRACSMGTAQKLGWGVGLGGFAWRLQESLRVPEQAGELVRALLNNDVGSGGFRAQSQRIRKAG